MTFALWPLDPVIGPQSTSAGEGAVGMGGRVGLGGTGFGAVVPAVLLPGAAVVLAAGLLEVLGVEFVD